MKSIEFVGIVASASVILAYVLISMNILNANSVMYQGLNLLGAVCFVWYTLTKRAWANVFTNALWGVIATVALVRIFFS